MSPEKNQTDKIRWLELSLALDGDDDSGLIPAVSEIFERLGEGGAVAEAGFADDEETPDLDKPFQLKTYVEADPSGRKRVEAIRDELKKLNPRHRVPELRVREMAEADWAESWKEGYTIQKPGDRIVIVPSWMEYRASGGEAVVRMNPGRAFGSGLHPTTRLCLIGLERMIKAGDRVLDIGTGSGILAIAALRLGAAHVTALDIEPEAVEVAWENFDDNGLSSPVTLLQGTCEELSDSIPKVDLVLANILAYTVIDLLPFIKSRLLPGGRLVSGGILNEYAGDVEKALLENGFKSPERIREKEWVSVLAALSEDLKFSE
ncbi:MAG TPA: 50S ribosomal protein L11 methyltransferase [Nitrospiria bacterium]|nr:50S ribosomal protein L11 methyltransferase [Nitrospiria bacterium]